MSKATDYAPSINALRKAFEEKIGYERVMIARGILKGKIRPDAIKQVATWIRSCYNEPSYHAKKMYALNVVLQMHGVEEIIDSNGYRLCEYLNSGDTYTTTLLFYNGKYHIGDWGSLLEFAERRGRHFD